MKNTLSLLILSSLILSGCQSVSVIEASGRDLETMVQETPTIPSNVNTKTVTNYVQNDSKNATYLIFERNKHGAFLGHARRLPADIYINNQFVCTLDMGETQKIAVTPGTQTLTVSYGGVGIFSRPKRQTVTFNTKARETHLVNINTFSNTLIQVK